MGFKIRQLGRGPAKVLNKIGGAGIFGKRKNHFRILGIPVGKDLVPIVQTTVTVAATVVGGPAAGIVTSGAVCGLSGGNESDLTHTLAVSAAGVGVSQVAKCCSTIAGQVATHAAGNVAIAAAIGEDLATAAISSVASSVVNMGDVTGNEIGNHALGSAIGGAINDEDNPLRGALQGSLQRSLQGVGSVLMAQTIGAIPISESDAVQVKLDEPKETRENSTERVKQLQCKEPEALDLIDAKSHDISSFIYDKSNKTESDNISKTTKIDVKPSDIYDIGTTLYYTETTTTQNECQNEKFAPIRHQKVFHENYCFTLRDVTKTSLNVTDVSHELHVNQECLTNSAIGATVVVGVLAVPELVVPALIANNLANN